MEADEFLAGIQEQMVLGTVSQPASRAAVRYFPEWCFGGGEGDAEQPPSHENFCEDDYLYSNPDIAGAIEDGRYRSGFDHWDQCGRSEGRGFHPASFIESDYLELNPDVAEAVRTREYRSGMAHWECCGRLEGRRFRKPMQVLASRLKRLGIEAQTRLAQIGEPPFAPNTLRGAVGRRVILVMRRLLWWYTQPLVAFGSSISEAGRQQTALLEYLDSAREQDQKRLISLRESVDELRSRTDGSEQLTRMLDARTEELIAGAVTVQNQLTEHLERANEDLRSQVADLSRQVGQLTSSLAAEMNAREVLAQQLANVSSNVQRFRADFTASVAARQKPSQESSECACSSTVAHTAEQRMGSLYIAFQDAFRGPREEVKRRQGVYLPFLEQSRAGTPGMPVLDLGCGRGEWIELLRERRLEVRGLDSNAAMVDQCRAMGMDVQCGEALSYLRSLPDASLGAVTSFHMIEHIPFDAVLELIDECTRVLKPGGLLILETPNPENLLVSTNYFYLDPTHLKPIPPALLQFFVTAKGFDDCHVLGLQPGPEPVRPEEKPGSECMTRLLYGPRDYGLIATRP